MQCQHSFLSILITTTGSCCLWLMLAQGTVVAEHDNKDPSSNCRLWLGPSYLSSESNNKYALYAGVDYDVNETIATNEIGFLLYDFLSSTNPAIHISHQHKEMIEYLESMMWTSDHAGTAKYEANSSATILIPGIGILTNHHTGYYNVDWEQASVMYREPYILPTNQAMPSRGVISPYYNFTMQATKQIPAGMELFGHYGVSDDDENESSTSKTKGDNMEKDSETSESVFQDKIRRKDYEIADRIIDQVLKYFQKFQSQLKNNRDLQEEIIDFMLETIVPGALGKRAKIIRSLIPGSTVKKLQLIKNAGGTFLYRYKDMIRSQSWLESHAFCVDTIEVKPSTIPHAGRGAFAKRNFKAGDIISPVPMVPVPTEEIFQLHQPVDFVEGSTNEFLYDTSTEPYAIQQIVNYAYGHPESSLLLIPAAPSVNYINHAPTEPGKDSFDPNKLANAYMEWSQHDYVYNDAHFQDSPLSDWTASELPSVVVMLKALRDIDEGEEIFVNYGQQWENAWEIYYLRWQSQYNASGIPMKWPLRALEMMAFYRDKPFPVNIRQGMTPYPENIVTGCYLMDAPKDVPDGTRRKNDQGNDISIWQGPSNAKGLLGQGLVVCDVMDRIPIYEDETNTTIVSYNYTILTRLRDAYDAPNVVQVEKVPHYAISLIDRPYTSDIHIPGAFRHWVGLDDKLFPQAWRNLRNLFDK